MENNNSTNQLDNQYNLPDINQIFEIDAENDFIIAIYDYLLNKCEYGDKLEVLSSAEKVIYLTLSFEAEINNGGFDQFFYNSTGDSTMDTLNSLKELGAVNTTKIFEKAISIFPNRYVPEDRSERQDLMDEILSDETEELLEELDDKFYEYEDNLLILHYDYIMNHKDEFK